MDRAKVISGSSSDWGWAPAAQRWYKYTRFIVYICIPMALYFGHGPVLMRFVLPAILLFILGDMDFLAKRWVTHRYFTPAGWTVLWIGFLWIAMTRNDWPIPIRIGAILLFVISAFPAWELWTLRCQNCGEPFFRREPPKWDSTVHYPLTNQACATCGIKLGIQVPEEM